MKLFIRFWRVFDFLLSFLAIMGMCIMTAMMLAVCWEVLSRYFLGRGTEWVIEFCEYALLYITFLGAAWLLKREGHVEMDLITIRLKQKMQTTIKGIVSILVAILCLLFTWFGSIVTLDHFRRGLHQPTAVGPPDFPIFAVIPIGFFLLFVQFLRKAYSMLVSKEWEKANKKVMS
ncbi:MAG: TRAP transporter small permease [Deltaproteobacteria bacterium]|nr:TRAP transporter small permease [Deltaproteobacteria bacterium]